MSRAGNPEDPFYQQLRAELVELLLQWRWPLPDAEDMAQTALLELLARRGKVREPYSYARAVNKRQPAALTRSRRREIAVGLDWPTEPSAVDVYHQGEVPVIGRELLAALWKRPRQRDVAALVIDGYTYREIAEKLDMELDNVRSTMRYARKALEPLVSDDDLRRRQVRHQVWEAFMRGETLPVAPRSVIRLAWWYSRALGVNPQTGARVVALGRDELSSRRQRSPLATVCPWVLTELAELGKTTEQMMVVTDAHGVVLWRGGAGTIMRKADEVGFIDGARWDIAHAGANGVGLALTAGQMVTVCQAEHYVQAQHDLSCVATPVTDRDGHVLAVLNLTGTHPAVHHAIRRDLDTIARRVKRQLMNDRLRL